MSVTKRVTDEYFFVNNCFGSFFRGILDWMGDDFYPRFQYKVIGTYDKAVEFFNKKRELGREVGAQILPSVSLDPAYDFSQEEKGGRFLWQNQYLSPGFGCKLFDPINLREQDVLVTPVFSRYQGTIELIFWLQSVYELLDFRTLFLQYTGGFGRYIRPKVFWSYIILPDSIKNFETDENVKLDWGNTDATYVHIDNINQTKFAHPVVLTPILKLDSLNDNSVKYGGDQIAEYKLSASMTYEIDLPTYMVLNNKIGAKIVVNFSMGSVYTKYSMIPPYTILKQAATIDPSIGRIPQDFKCYRIMPTELDTAKKILDVQGAITNPQSTDIISWNPIFRGRLVSVSNDNYQNVQFDKGDILLCQEFKQNYLSLLRKSSGMLCRQGGYESLAYKKSVVLTKPLLSNIYDININEYINHSITVDTFNKKAYLGELAIEEIPTNDPEFGYDVYKKLKETKPEVLQLAQQQTGLPSSPPETYVTDEVNREDITMGPTNGLQTIFRLPTVPENTNTIKVYIDKDIQNPLQDYTIASNNLIFVRPPVAGSIVRVHDNNFIIKNVRLAATYIFTQTDIDNMTTEYIVVVLPFAVRSIKDLILVSYAGIMEYEKDWLFNIIEQKLTIKIKPKIEEIVEIFHAEA